ncbi:MAG: DUF126 domain-containing protein [Firmicutes bacterium]|jgi:predicted aconitase with swiveling domain|nr:DUF126 domain-containing protein [Bacillota bacterium]
MTKVVLKGHRVVKGRAEGEALVGKDAISFWGGVDPDTGVVQEHGHDLQGNCVAGKILVYTTGKGSVGGSARLYSMIRKGVGPKAIVNVDAESVTTIGAIMGGIPVVDHLDQDPTNIIKTGDYVIVDADNGVVEVIKATEERH